MRVFVLTLLALATLPASASATWSVIAVDRATGRVVIASATCVDRDDQFLMSVQAVVVPGKGVAACQAGVDPTHTNQMLVFRELQKGTDPVRIIEMLSEVIRKLNKDLGLTTLLIEQNLDFVMACSDRCYVMEKGSLVAELQPKALADAETARRYLAI